MNKEWSLEVLYSGFEDVKYSDDKKRLQQLIEELTLFCESIGDLQEEVAFVKAVDFLEQLKLLESSLGYYLNFKQSVNTQDNETVNELNVFDRLMSLSKKPLSVLIKYLAGISEISRYYDKYPKFKEYDYLFSEYKKEAMYLLGDDIEEVMAKLNISAATAWSNMQSFLTSTLEVEYRDNKITLPEVRNKAHDKDVDVRRDAYVAELQAVEKIKDAVCYSLNSIKSQVNTVSDLRGYKSPLEMTLIEARMKKETLEAMLEAIRESLPVFHKYLRHKAQLLGHPNGLPWYDLFAPLGETDRKFTVEEAKAYLIRHFEGFTKDLADMVEEAFDQAWIDFYPRKGKVGGAFCENMPFVKQSRILTNFTGSLSDVVTLAHELGHAYHGQNIQEHLPLNVDYSMPVAETASTFNEALIMEAAINEAEGKEKVALIESQLQDITQIICDIYSRYLFETEVFEKSKNGFLFAEELKEIMLKAQKAAYGDGLDHDYLHPYMWVVKPHYYSDDVSYYNFPYAFGGLFARGLYTKFKDEGQAFVPKYKALLKATTVMNVEDAAKQAEIDLEDPQFWRISLKSIEALIEQFIELT